MYKVFLVDDEISVRDNIRNIIQKETPFIFSGEASNGQTALSMILDVKPDILITDIKMPFMDGLELSAAIKKSLPWIKIIILSEHDDFSYAKQAISIGVQEYLLKPAVPEDLLSALKKVAEIIDAERCERCNLAMLQNRLDCACRSIRDSFLCDVITAKMQDSELLERARRMNIDLESKYYLVAVIGTDSHHSDLNSLQQINTIISEKIELRSDVFSFFFGSEKIVLLIKSDSAEELEKSAYELVLSIKHDAEQNADIRLIIGIGSVCEKIGNIPLSFADVEYARRSMMGYQHSGIAEINDLDQSSYPTIPDRNIIEDKLKYGNKSDIDSIINEYNKSADSSYIHLPMFACYIIIDLLLVCSEYVTELGGNVNEVLPDMADIKKNIYSTVSADKFRQIASGILTAVYNFRDSKNNSRYGSIIMQAKRYIAANYAKQGICLSSVASEVSMSPNHFSAIFSQETGITFIEYLTSVRINKAKELLIGTNMRSSDISFAVGYNDPHYFSYFFKKHVGISPREFRSNNK